MKLTAPKLAPHIELRDIDGMPIIIGNGRKLLLSFFDEASCPFCNSRVFDLTHNYRDFAARGLDIVVVFSSTEHDIRRFVAKQPRPFRMVADPTGESHRLYGSERSIRGKLKAMFTRMPALLRGLGMVGLAGARTRNLLPADFLIDGEGRVVETYYGRDSGDHIPMGRVEAFAARPALTAAWPERPVMG